MSSSKLARRESRLKAVKAFFYYLEREGDKDISECLDFVLEDVEDQKGPDAFATSIATMGVDQIGKLKVILRVFAPQFPYEKIAPINRALLLLGLGEMKYLGTPPVVVINEYVDLAKTFGEEKSAPFINGVLDNFRKSAGLEGSKKEEHGS